MDRKETLPPLAEMDSPPMSPRKQPRPIKAADSQNSQQGRSVDELKELIRKKLQNNYQAFEEVNFVSFCYVNMFLCCSTFSPDNFRSVWDEIAFDVTKERANRYRP